MNIRKSQKTMRVLYLYLTVPLLLATMVLVAIATMSATSTKRESPAAYAPPDPAAKHETMRPHVEVPEAMAHNEDPSSTTAGQTAIITAIFTGITGLLGAIMQTIVAFLKLKQRRRNDSDDD